MNRWWIWLIPQFLVLNLSFGQDLNYTNSKYLQNLYPQYYSPSKFPTSEEIEDKSPCEKYWTCQNFHVLCFCDDLCLLFNDCCEDKTISNTTEISFQETPEVNQNSSDDEGRLNWINRLKDPLPKNTFTCFTDSKDFTFYKIVNCPVDYENDFVRKNCEQPEKEDPFMHHPVSGIFPNASQNTKAVIFYNVFCALCHGLTDGKLWRPSETCDTYARKFNIEVDNPTTENNDTSELNGNCSYVKPANVSHRECRIIIDDCPDNTSNYDRLKCTQGPYQPIALNEIYYKNKFCALCHKVETTQMSCLIFKWRALYESVFSFTTIWDLNFNSLIKKCDKTSILDPHTNKCRKLHRPNFCKKGNITISDPTIKCPDCELIKLDESKYNQFQIPQRNFPNSNMTINQSLFIDINNVVYICSKDYNVKSKSVKVETFEILQDYISVVGLSLSLLLLLITFCIYASFASLQNVPGKMSMNLMASMFFANLLFLLRFLPKMCTWTAISMHYMYLVSFFWMNALSFDSWSTFSTTAGSRRSKSSYMYYVIYSWVTPLFIMISSVCVQYVPNGKMPSWLSPNYGPPLCWISNKWALLIFFAVPLFVLILSNVVFYTLTIHAICRTEKFSGRVLSKKNKGMFLIYLKLCFIMGINWVFALLHAFTQSKFIGFLAVILNSLQGFFVGCSFLFTRQIYRKFKGKFITMGFVRKLTEGKDTITKQTSTTYVIGIQKLIENENNEKYC